MGVNGVSHHIVQDDLAGVAAVLRWLSYTPVLIGDAPPLLPSSDPVDRLIAYRPQEGKYLQTRLDICMHGPGSTRFWRPACPPVKPDSSLSCGL